MEELQRAFSLSSKSQERVKKELDRCVADNPPLLGLDGNPTPDSLARVNQSVMLLIDSYIKEPTITEQGQSSLSNLATNSIEGASLSLTTLVSLVMFNPMEQISPMVAPVAPMVFSHLLAFLNQEKLVGKEGFERLQKEVSDHINLRATDGNGVEIILTEELAREKMTQAQGALVWFISQGERMGLFVAEETGAGFGYTPKGERLMKHFMAANQWIHDIQESHQEIQKHSIAP
jgi:hypothetical protein